MNSFIKTNVTLKELADYMKCEFTGRAEAAIDHIGDINYLVERESDFEQNCIYYIQSEKILTKLQYTRDHSIFLTDEGTAKKFPNSIITGKSPKLDFIKLLEFFNSKIFCEINLNSPIHSTAKISPGSKIAPGVYIGEGVVIEDDCTIHANAVIEPFAKISKNSIIHSGVFIGRHCIIGSHCIIYPNAVIGADGFGYTDENNTRYKIPQIGNVVLGNFVEIGACTTVDRSTIESTTIGDNTKIDNLVQIAHNCRIGKNVYIAGKASLAGSVKVRDRAILAGGCGIRDHVCIAEGSVVLAFTGIEEDTEPNQTYFGIPARKVREMHRINSALNHLPELLKTVKQWQKNKT